MTEVTLKQIVEIELKRQKRSLSWLAIEVGMSIDGLRLSLLRESIKYADIVKVCEVLGVRAGLLFGETEVASVSHNNRVAESESELIALLKSQLRDKERIIELMGGQSYLYSGRR